MLPRLCGVLTALLSTLLTATMPKISFGDALAEGCANQATSLVCAYLLTGEKSYLTNAYRNMDYILGKNATGYCYVTGFGMKSPLYPHHRLSASDDIEAPLPGFLVGGPNPGQQGRCTLSFQSAG